jgi:hypothetical protein
MPAPMPTLARRLLWIVMLLLPPAAMIATTIVIPKTSYRPSGILSARESKERLRSYVENELNRLEEQPKLQWEDVDWHYYECLRLTAQ